MEVGAFQSVNKVSFENAGVTQGAQGVTALFEGSGFAGFEMLLQQLLASSTVTADPNQQGFSMPFGSLPTDGSLFTGLPINPEGQMSIPAEQLQGLLGQFGFQDLSGLAVPQIAQELQELLNQANALGLAEVDLSGVFGNASVEQGVELLNFVDANAPFGLNDTQLALKGALEARLQGNSQNPAQGQDTLGQALKDFMMVQQEGDKTQGTNTLAKDGLMGELFQKSGTQGAVATQDGRPAVLDMQAQAQPNLMIQSVQMANTAIPEYLNPELQQQELLNQQVQHGLQQPISKDAVEIHVRPLTPDASGRNEQSLMDALSLGGSPSGGGSNAETDLQNSLNLTDQNKPSENSGSTNEAETVKAENANTRFVDNLKRLQEAQSVINQIAKNVHLRQGAQNTEIAIKLEPEYLGNLNLNVRLEEGALSVQILAENGQVRDMLETNMTALKNSLEQSDIRVKNIDVSVSEDSEDSLADAQLEGGAAGKEANGSHNESSLNSAFGAESDQNSHEESTRPSLSDSLYQVNALA